MIPAGSTKRRRFVFPVDQEESASASTTVRVKQEVTSTPPAIMAKIECDPMSEKARRVQRLRDELAQAELELNLTADVKAEPVDDDGFKVMVSKFAEETKGNPMCVDSD